MQDVVIEKQVVVGHLARRLPKQIGDATHHWKIFLYSPTGEDLTKWIDKCVFHLHDSFKDPDRICVKEPYIVSEDGWGEFQVRVEIFPKCAISFSLLHDIVFPQPQSKKPALISKREEKIVFRNPPPILYEGLTAAPFTWNKFKNIKNQPKGSDVEVLDFPSSDANLENKWKNHVDKVSEAIREEIQGLVEKHKARMERIQTLLETIRANNADIAEAASLFI